MRNKIQAAVLTAAVAFVLNGAVLGAAQTTVTGKVSDAMCGAKHMGDDEAGCTRECVKKGSAYALVDKDKVYELKATAAQKAELDKLAGKTAKVTGNLKGKTITVTAVEPAN